MDISIVVVNNDMCTDWSPVYCIFIKRDALACDPSLKLTYQENVTQKLRILLKYKQNKIYVQWVTSLIYLFTSLAAFSSHESWCLINLHRVVDWWAKPLYVKTHGPLRGMIEMLTILVSSIWMIEIFFHGKCLGIYCAFDLVVFHYTGIML